MRRFPARIALLVLTVLALAAAGYRLLPDGEPGPRTITAQFDNAIGLYQGNTVAVLGMPVGTVERITARGGYVEVVLAIEDANLRIPADVQAVTVSTSILTDRHVELTPAYTGGPTLGDGAVLGLDRTKTPVEFDRVLQMVDKLGTSMRGDGKGGGPMAEVLDATTAVAQSSGSQLKSALAKLAEAIRTGDDDGRATRQSITTVIDNLGKLSDAAARNQDLIHEFGSGVGRLSELLAAEGIGRGETGHRLNQVLDQLNTLLTDHGDDLRATVASSASVSQALVDYRRELTELLDVAPLAVDNVVAAIDQRNGYLRVGAHFDNVFFDSSMTKEVCNILGLRQLGCSTGKMSDMGPDFGLTSMLEAMTRLGK
ncbi:MCE family protein [Nocardia sp. CDC159]|uniref:MCE family protein n=1 Tax=Nocardia pulmonis TaxID=2951408 RepID=A0A9X2IW82_9NOCA|nr:MULTISPECIES: MCE family protein [Nocardia]MCM6772570.1 MCE family protein [Nocardia pulmonis]MCM6784772.1 MCE family protein [Nocardia sp. CDC159]